MRAPQPLPDLEEAAAKLEERSLYAAPFPFDTGLDQLQAFFSEQGAVRSVRLRRHLGSADFKGSVFVEFETAELAGEVRLRGVSYKGWNPAAPEAGKAVRVLQPGMRGPRVRAQPDWPWR